MAGKRDATTANELIERQLDQHAEALEAHLNKDVLGVFGGMRYGIEERIRDAVEHRKLSAKPERRALAVVLETGGGFIEVVQRIVDTLRTHYETVDFVVPNYAMSAGTVLAMSGDAIHMNYFSVLGPIDPQVPRADGNGYLPALGYLEQYKRMVEKDIKGELSTVEASFFLSKFDPGELFSFEQAKRLSIALLEDWLVAYKFKNWTETETTKTPVDDAMRKSRAVEIAEKLNDTQLWHSHGRGISMAVLDRDLNLRIDDYGWKGETYDKISAYHTLMNDYMVRIGQTGAVHASGHYRRWH